MERQNNSDLQAMLDEAIAIIARTPSAGLLYISLMEQKGLPTNYFFDWPEALLPIMQMLEVIATAKSEGMTAEELRIPTLGVNSMVDKGVKTIGSLFQA